MVIGVLRILKKKHILFFDQQLNGAYLKPVFWYNLILSFAKVESHQKNPNSRTVKISAWNKKAGINFICQANQ